MGRCFPGCQCRRHQASGRPKGSGVTPWQVRFRAKVDRRGLDECWPWTGAVVQDADGRIPRGKFWMDSPESGKWTCFLAPRVAFYLAHGRWPQPQALHCCDNALCCNAENPDHIHEGTAKQNTAEMCARGRWAPPPVLMGSQAGRSRLTDAQALEIIARYSAGGVSQPGLAAEYGVSQASISYIVSGKRRSLQ